MGSERIQLQYKTSLVVSLLSVFYYVTAADTKTWGIVVENGKTKAIPQATMTAVKSPNEPATLQEPSLSCGLSCPTSDQGVDVWGNWWGCNSSYAPDSGTWVKTDDAKDDCQTDLFIVHTTKHNKYWKPLHKVAIDCGSGEACDTKLTNNTSSCASYSVGITFQESIAAEIFLALILGGFFSVSETITETQSHCINTTLEENCSWGPGCHSLWGSDEVQQTFGYIRRTCLIEEDGDNTARTHLNVTLWSHDVAFESPTGWTAVGCSASCDDKAYPGPNPDPNYEPLPSNNRACPTSNAWHLRATKSALLVPLAVAIVLCV